MSYDLEDKKERLMGFREFARSLTMPVKTANGTAQPQNMPALFAQAMEIAYIRGLKGSDDNPASLNQPVISSETRLGFRRYAERYRLSWDTSDKLYKPTNISILMSKAMYFAYLKGLTDGGFRDPEVSLDPDDASPLSKERIPRNLHGVIFQIGSQNNGGRLNFNPDAGPRFVFIKDKSSPRWSIHPYSSLRQQKTISDKSVHAIVRLGILHRVAFEGIPDEFDDREIFGLSTKGIATYRMMFVDFGR